MRTAMCAVVKNEARIIKEWLLFHAKIGFQKFLIYDNGSTDETVEIARGVARSVDIELIDWSSAVPIDYQKSAYRHALANYGEMFDWMAFFDADEFFIPVRDGSLPGFLSHFEHHDAIAVPWAMFGSSGLMHSDYDLVTETFLRRAPDDFGPNRHMKSLIRPKAHADFANGHMIDSVSGYVGVDGKPVAWQQPGLTASAQDISIARLNHYFTRSRADWNRKISRGYGDMVRPDAEFELYDRNEIEDISALCFTQDLKNKLEEK